MATSTSEEEDTTTLKEEVCDEENQTQTSNSVKLKSTCISSKGTQEGPQKRLARRRSCIPILTQRPLPQLCLVTSNKSFSRSKSCIPTLGGRSLSHTKLHVTKPIAPTTPAHPQLHEPVTKNPQPLNTKDTPSPTTTPPVHPQLHEPVTKRDDFIEKLIEREINAFSSELSLTPAPMPTACTESPISQCLYKREFSPPVRMRGCSPRDDDGAAKFVVKSKIKPSLYTIIDSPTSSLRSSPTFRSPSPDECITVNILIIGGEGCGKTTVKNHLQIPGGLEAEVIDTFGIEYDTFFKETKDKVLGHYRNIHLIVFVLKYEEEPDKEAIQNQFGLFDKYFTQEVHPITVLVITHCERNKNEEVIETYTQLCPTDRAKLGIIPVGFIENPSGPWKGKIIKKMKDDKEILQNLVLKCIDPVPASQIFKEQPPKVPRKKDIAPNLVEI